jgi:hypothetical protein
MKKLIYGISFLAIAGGAILVACNKQNLNPTLKQSTQTETVSDVEKSDVVTSLFYRSVAILPKSHLIISGGSEYVQQFSLLMFDESYTPLESYIINNVDYTDDGKFNDQVAGDGVYTSVITRPIASYVPVPADVAFASDDFEHFDEAASEFHITFKCKIRTTYEGYSAMHIPCSWGGCIEIYACKGEISFFD